MFSSASHQDLRASIESIGAGVAIFNLDKTLSTTSLVSANSRFAEYIGWKLSDILGKDLKELFPRYIANELQNTIVGCIDSQHASDLEIPLNSFGENSYWRCFISPISRQSDNLPRVILTLTDISEKKLLEKELAQVAERFRAVVESAYDGIVTIDSSEKIRLANQAALNIFEHESLNGLSLNTLIPQRYRTKHRTYLESFRESDVESRPMYKRSSIMGLKKSGQEIPLEITISRIQLHSETELMAVIRDVSERQHMIDELRLAATTDSLTGLFNRRYFVPLLEAEIDRSIRYGNALCLLMIDIDHFKEINDEHGHAAGDTLLTGFAKACQSACRKIDVICRWGGEEFAILAPECTLEGALNIAEKLRKLLEGMEIICLEEVLSATVSVGVADVKQLSVVNSENLLALADQAMYLAKGDGRNCIRST